jgi:hypothetical protein
MDASPSTSASWATRYHIKKISLNKMIKEASTSSPAWSSRYLMLAVNTQIARRRRIPNAQGINIVCKLSTRSIRGQHMGIEIHQHYRNKLHLTWNATTYPQHAERTNYRRKKILTTITEISQICIERQSLFEHGMRELVKQPTSNPIRGVCACLWGRNFPWRRRITRKFPRCWNWSLAYTKHPDANIKPQEWLIRYW